MRAAWRQRTQAINALRGHPSRVHVKKLKDALLASPDLVHEIAADLQERIDSLNEKIGEIDSRITALEDEERLMSMPGVGPLTASAAFAPPMENFRSWRDFAVWLTLREDNTEVRLGWCDVMLSAASTAAQFCFGKPTCSLTERVANCLAGHPSAGSHGAFGVS